jgi:hypothetical protein
LREKELPDNRHIETHNKVFIPDFNIYRLMTDEDDSLEQTFPPESRKKVADKAQRQRVTVAIVITMIILGAALVGYMFYQYFQASQTEVSVLDVEIEIKDTGEGVHIIRIETIQKKEDLLSSPRSDDNAVFPGVRAKLLSGQDVLSYDAFTTYKGSGIYTLSLGLKDTIESNSIITCTAWVYTGDQGSYADDQESAIVVWGPARTVEVLKAEITMEGNLSTGSNARISNVEISQLPNKMEMDNFPSHYPGIYGYIHRNNNYASFIATEPYTGSGDYNLFIGLLFQPQVGETMTIVIEVWQRNGDWLEGEYQSTTDSMTLTHTWS